MNTEIITNFPPNYNDIMILNPPMDAIFAYKGKIYNPIGKEIPEDILCHEEVHIRQQKDDSDEWWRLYIENKDFRQEQEVEAFREQLKWVRKRYTKKGVELALNEFAENLSKNYRLNLSVSQCETLIRKKWKKI